MAAKEILQALNMMLDKQERREDREAAKSLQLLSMSLQAETRQTERAQEVMLKEYYNKQDQVRATEAMYEKYESLSPQDVSPGGNDMASMIIDGNEIDMNALDSNMQKLGDYHSQLKGGLAQVNQQIADFSKYEHKFYGENRLLQPGTEADQMKAFFLDKKEGLGYDNLAGFDQAFAKMSPSERYVAASNISKDIKTDLIKERDNSYTVFSAGVSGDKAEAFLSYEDVRGKVHEPPPEILEELKGMVLNFPDAGNFLDYIYSMPQHKGGAQMQAYLRGNPSINGMIKTMENAQITISALDDELAGINQTERDTELEKFVESVSVLPMGTDDNLETLFTAYDVYVKGRPAEEHAQAFSAIELIAGRNLGADYTELRKDPVEEPEEDELTGVFRVPIVKAGYKLGSVAQETAVDLAAMGINVVAGPANYLTYWATGYNPGMSGSQTMSNLGFDTYFKDQEPTGFWESSWYDEAISHPGGLGRGRSEWSPEAVKDKDMFSPFDDIPEWYRSE